MRERHGIHHQSEYNELTFYPHYSSFLMPENFRPKTEETTDVYCSFYYWGKFIENPFIATAGTSGFISFNYFLERNEE